MKTINSLQDELAGILHSTNVDKVHNFFGVVNRAARKCVGDIDFFETKRVAEITTPVFDEIYNYAVPNDLKINRIIDIRPQVNRETEDNFDQTFSESFDINKSQNSFTVEYIQGDVKTLRISEDTGITQKQVTSINSKDDWSVGNDATNLTEDDVYYISSQTSLNFDLDGSTTDGFIENSSLTSTDLSDEEDNSSFFLYVYMPDSSIITSVDLRWGNDSSNYFNRTVSAPHFGNSFKDGWNLLRFDWDGSSSTGSPDSSVIDYTRITINYDGTAETDIRVDDLINVRGRIYEIQYYSDYLFQDGSTGNRIEEADTLDDKLILEGQSINIFLFKMAEMAAQQVQEQNGSADVQYFRQEYQDAKSEYQSKYPSETIKPKETYYKIKGSANSRVNRIFN